jgi:hypothetical protein
MDDFWNEPGDVDLAGLDAVMVLWRVQNEARGRSGR